MVRHRLQSLPTDSHRPSARPTGRYFRPPALASLETYRELSDYTSAGRFGKAEAAQAIARAEAFIAACRALIPGGGR